MEGDTALHDTQATYEQTEALKASQGLPSSISSNAPADLGNSAIDYNALSNMSSEDMYKYLAANDKVNSSAWLTNYASLKAQKEMRDTSIISTMDQMKKAGINPLLAVNQLGTVGGSGSGYGAVSDVGTSSMSYITTKMNNATEITKAMIQAVSKILSSFF